MAKAQASNENVKIGLLAGAIVVVLGFVAFSMLRRSGGSASAPPTTTTANPIQIGTATESQLDAPIVSIFDPTINPFRTTVKLGGSNDRSSGVGSGNESKRSTTDSVPTWGGPLPGVSDDGGVLGPMPVTAPPTKLSGVIVDDKPSALVVFDSKSEILGIGDLIPGEYRIISIDAGGISVRKGTKVFRILIGETFMGAPAESAGPPNVGLPGIEAVPH